MKRSTVCSFCRLSIFGLILLFLCTISALADVNGAVVGTVADASGAVVAGVTVSLTNSGNGFARQTTTAKDGTYEFSRSRSERDTQSRRRWLVSQSRTDRDSITGEPETAG